MKAKQLEEKIKEISAKTGVSFIPSKHFLERYEERHVPANIVMNVLFDVGIKHKKYVFEQTNERETVVFVGKGMIICCARTNGQGIFLKTLYPLIGDRFPEDYIPV